MQGLSLPFSPKCTSCLAAVWSIMPIYFSDEEVYFIPMGMMAEQVSLLYKNKWQIALFFKWIKQHLKIKSF